MVCNELKCSDNRNKGEMLTTVPPARTHLSPHHGAMSRCTRLKELTRGPDVASRAATPVVQPVVVNDAE